MKKWLIAINKTIKNSIDLINSSEILKDRQKKDDKNLKLSLQDSKRKPLEALDNLTMIFDAKKNNNILNFRLKKSSPSNKTRYDSIYLINNQD